MKKILITFTITLFSSYFFGQNKENDKLIELSKAYKNFMFMTEAPKGFITELGINIPNELKTSFNFISQTITKDNDLFKSTYLVLPNDQTLKFIYIIRSVDANMRDEKQIDNNKLIDSLKIVDIPRNELIVNYYSMLFTGVGNKIKPFDFSKIDFKLNEYNLLNETEKGIFFLECMKNCGTEIWGYMNIVQPPNSKKALDYINKYPKFNGLEYYQFTDLNFPDFEMVIIKDKGIQSYKAFYIDKYYNVLISHLVCLVYEKEKEKYSTDLLLGSILKDESLYKYTKQKAVLEELFKEQK